MQPAPSEAPLPPAGASPDAQVPRRVFSSVHAAERWGSLQSMERAEARHESTLSRSGAQLSGTVWTRCSHCSRHSFHCTWLGSAVHLWSTFEQTESHEALDPHPGSAAAAMARARAQNID